MPGQLLFVLHAHLPFVRHPEHDEFLEEDWLFEGITETYAPLLKSLIALRDEGVPFRLAMTVTPTLAAMLDDDLLRQKYARHLTNLRALADTEAQNHAADTPMGRAARHYVGRFAEVDAFLKRWGGDLLAPIRELQSSRHLEVIACNATHGFLPLMSGEPARRAQIRAGVSAHTRCFGRRPRGMWVAECAWDHGFDRLLAEEGIGYTFLDTAAVTHARPQPKAGVHAPVRTPAGPIVFARDIETGRQVWSAREGYPGDELYREFYRDVGWDASYEYIRPYLHEDGLRRSLGVKYHRVTGKVDLGQKTLWEPEPAFARAREHARDFVAKRRAQFAGLAPDAIVVACYDAELFGHWWYEGTVFVEEVLRAAASETTFTTATPSEAIAAHPEPETVTPNPSTWGAGSTNQVWLCAPNSWLYRYQHWAEAEMTTLVHKHAQSGGLPLRALRQAGRELLLMQSSDWAFMLAAGTTAAYAARRFKQHFAAFQALRDELVTGPLEERGIALRESATPIFPNLDVTAWG